MSGRDYKNFVTNHRDGADVSKLICRVTDGLGSNKYKAVDYDKLRSLASEKKFSSHKSLLKVKKLEQVRKQNKENNLLKQQRLIWHKEFIRLNNVRRRLQAEVDQQSRLNTTEHGTCAQIYQHLEDYEMQLSVELSKFKIDTADPIWTLREDLQFWLTENSEDLQMGNPDIVKRHQEIQATVNSVKQQQRHLLERLRNEQLCLEADLEDAGDLSSLTAPLGCGRLVTVSEGIPAEAQEIDCPDRQLKSSVLQEFLVIDEKYSSRLKNLDLEHEQLFRSDCYGGWSEDDHYVLQVICDQYPYDLPNRRTLFLDRLKRHLPHIKKAEMVSHEEWWRLFRYYHERRRVLMNNWHRDRHELLMKAKVVFDDACMTFGLEEIKSEHRQRQAELCDALYEKVRKWRDQKLEAMALEMQIEERRKAEQEKHTEYMMELDQKRRQGDRDKIQAYHEQHEILIRRQEDKDRKRLVELQQLLAEQAVLDKERVVFREEQFQQKLQERKQRELELEEDELQKERRLESIRETVRVVAESDPDRLLHETKTWHAHIAEEDEGDDAIQKPLFQMHTYTSKQVTSDPRVRIEQKLREAGLHQSEYARKILSTVHPPRPPRKDMESNVFKQLE